MRKHVSILLVMALLAILTGCDPYSRHVGTTTLPSQSTAEVVESVQKTDATVSADHVHSYLAQLVDATCTEGGYMLHICSCADQFKDNFTDALGHTWSPWVTIQVPTQTDEGLQERTCQTCADTQQQVLERLTADHTHSYQAETIAPTCTQAGYTQYTCACGESYREDGAAATGHSWGEWVVTEEPTTTADGQQSRTCTQCGANDTCILEKLPAAHEHSYTKEKVAATCTQSGYTIYRCPCGDSYQQTGAQPEGHDWAQWYVLVEPTTTSEGQRQRTCQVCGDVETQDLEMLQTEDGFVFVYWPETTGRNVQASVVIKGQPGVTYDIDVYYKSGASSAKGLEDKVADADGYVTWTWKVGPSTAAGTYRIVVSGGGQEQTVYFTVVVE